MDDVSDLQRLTKRITALGKYVERYQKLCDVDDNDGASDTAVRETVFWFLETVCKAIGNVKLADIVWSAVRYGDL